MNPPPNPRKEELLTRWIDGQLPPEEATPGPHWHKVKEESRQLGEWLRRHLPATLEPPSPEFFTHRVMESIARESVPPRPVRRRSPWLRWLDLPGFAPLASAAAVALGFLAWNHAAIPAHEPGPPALAYAPDSRVKATAWYSEEAGATVIDLQNLDALPDQREIRAFDVATAPPPAPGKPTVLYAASGDTRPVLVLSEDADGQPRITALH